MPFRRPYDACSAWTVAVVLIGCLAAPTACTIEGIVGGPGPQGSPPPQDPPPPAPPDLPIGPPGWGLDCPESLTACGSSCVNVDTDPHHCGRCDETCNLDEDCRDGACVPFELYWGELHGHSGLSDGEGTPTEYFTYCRDVSLMDFCALTDHNVDQTDLETVTAEADQFDSPTFVAFNGNEWTTGEYCHRCCYDISVTCQPWADDCDTPAKLHEVIRQTGGLCHTAHPDTDWGTPVDWSTASDDVEVSGEIYATEEKMNEAWRDYGLKMGVVGISDTHSGTPGAGGVTGCFAAELTREGILEALGSRRCFATRSRANASERPVSLIFKLNDRWMGATLTVEAGTPLAMSVFVDASVTIDAIAIKKDGQELALKDDCAATTCEWHHTVTADGPAYYYVVVSLSGNTIWSPPIFVE